MNSAKIVGTPFGAETLEQIRGKEIHHSIRKKEEARVSEKVLE